MACQDPFVVFPGLLFVFFSLVSRLHTATPFTQFSQSSRLHKETILDRVLILVTLAREHTLSAYSAVLEVNLKFQYFRWEDFFIEFKICTCHFASFRDILSNWTFLK